AQAQMIDHIDHIVLTTRDKLACIRFYTDVLGMKLVTFKTPTEERLAFSFGNQKINLHEWGREFEPRAHVAVPGSLRLCAGPRSQPGGDLGLRELSRVGIRPTRQHRLASGMFVPWQRKQRRRRSRTRSTCSSRTTRR